MASSSSSSIFTTEEGDSNVAVSQDEFNHFHNIDRRLFLCLVVHIGLDATQAMQVMALFMWFERTCGDFSLISKLLKWPNTLLNDLTNEAISVLSCIQNEHYFPSNVTTKNNYALPLTQKITKSGVTLNFFHQKRVEINQAITNLINNVCCRAFGDIVQHLKHGKVANNNNDPIMMQQQMMSCINPIASRTMVAAQVNEVSSKETMNNQVLEVLRRIELGGGAYNPTTPDVPADDRTIFLTFSKGYPIFESEIRDFFSRRYGDIIEAVYMQEVETMVEQPLYARLVLRGDAINMMEVILGGTRKAKFSINGKHVWARKYVRKTTKSPLIISPPTSLPDSPAASSASATFQN
ncbi:uncharacterized protein G2W53_027892 [Senna tora]|uniref:Uncharacterized protein n=1 Tax=Senna tora TaxID=362788 RepID=A0A834TJI3_9FABA|nr:uncharacterized protein G2W53_027892 [Senna tora]